MRRFLNVLAMLVVVATLAVVPLASTNAEITTSAYAAAMCSGSPAEQDLDAPGAVGILGLADIRVSANAASAFTSLASSSATAIVGRNYLAAIASADASTISPHHNEAGARASAVWNDMLSFTKTIPVAELNSLPRQLKVNATLSGVIYMDLYSGYWEKEGFSGFKRGRWAEASGTFSIFGHGVTLAHTHTDGLFPPTVPSPSPYIESKSQPYQIQYQLDPARWQYVLYPGDTQVTVSYPIPWNMSASAEANALPASKAFANFGHTLRIDSITLPEFGDSTPEELGFSLVFDSGMPSPNAVPEPSGFVLIYFGLFGLLVWFWRHKRNHLCTNL